MSEYWTEDAPGRPTAIASSLETDLVSFWRLDETSGTRYDAFSVHNLTEVGSVAQIPGKIGQGAGFDSAPGVQHLFALNTPELFTGDTSFTVHIWQRMTAKPSVGIGMSKGNNADGWDWDIGYSGFAAEDRWAFSLYLLDGTFLEWALAHSFGSPPLNIWNLLIGWYDKPGGRIYVQVNNGPVDSVAVNRTSLDAKGPLTIGDWQDFPNHWDGGVDNAAVWKRLLTAKERTLLWNDGAGLDFLTPLSAFWVQPLDGIRDWQKPGILPLLEVGGVLSSTSLVIADGT